MKSLLGATSKFLFFLSLLIYSACSSPKQNIAPPPMWGDLQAGPYAVGYTTQFLYDQTRPAIPYSEWNGNLFPTTEMAGRQMQINIWYPAQVSSSAKRLSFEHYVHLLGMQTDFGELDQEKIDFARRQFIEKTNSLGGNGNFTAASLDSLCKLQTHAFLDAKVLNQTFPLVVFPNGNSPAFQSIMCEYLASHGFVVAGMALKGLHAYGEEVSFRGMETTMIDLEFAIRQLIDLPYVDKLKIGLVANAITSSQIVAYQSRNANIDCLVSLEGGLISSFEQRILNKTAFYQPDAVDVPILALYSPHPHIDPSYIAHLKHADKYFFRLPGMTEFHALNFGPFDRFSPNIIGEHEGDVQGGYETDCLLIQRFLEAFLYDKESSQQMLTQPLSEALKQHIDTSFIQPGIPRVPDITEIKQAFTQHGMQYIDSLYWQQKKLDSIPFSQSFYADLKDWLAWKKDPEFTARYQLYKLAWDSYPNSAEVHYHLAWFALEIEDSEACRFHVKRGLAILEGNENPELTVGRAEWLKGDLKAILSELPK